MEISPGNLYYHFRGKEIIIEELYDQFDREMAEILTAPIQKTISVQDNTGAVTTPLHVTPSSKLFVDRTITFESLFTDMEVKVKFNPETHELLKLEGKDLRAPIERFLEKNQ